MRELGCLLQALCSLLFAPVTAQPEPAIPAGSPYAIGSVVLQDRFIDPVNGSDSGDGSAARPWRTLSHGWRQLPMGVPLTQGVRFVLRPGPYTAETIPNYWESRYGSAAAPIVVTSEQGAASVQLPNVNVFDVSYLYFLDVTMAGGGDVFHCERCDHLLLRGVIIRGFEPETFDTQEAIKINQSRFVFIENSDISGAWDNAIDLVAVQHGQIIDSRIHNAGDWCTYVKGGSTGWLVARNRFYDCGTGGFTAGQGTGFEFMTPPWLHYEAMGVVFTDNVIHDTQGAAFGVNGGANILIANNVAYRVGARSHVLEVTHGLRSCDGNVQVCAQHRAAGGWGPAATDVELFIPNLNVYIVNNVIYNPPGYQSEWQQFFIAGPRSPSPFAQPAPADLDLIIAGNLIVNGGVGHPLGIEDGEACFAANPTCNATQLRRDNAINTSTRAILVDPERGDFRLAPGVVVPRVAVPTFVWR